MTPKQPVLGEDRGSRGRRLPLGHPRSRLNAVTEKQEQRHWSDVVLFWVVVVVLAIYEVLIFDMYEPPWLPATALTLGAIAGFVTSTFMEWLRFYVYWHPRAGIKRGDEDALRPIDRVIGVVIAGTMVPVLIAIYAGWLPDAAAKAALGFISGFFLFQYWPDRRGKDRWFAWTGRLFIRMFGWLMGRRGSRPNPDQRSIDTQQRS